MKLNPKERGGKGTFPETPPSVVPDDSLIDDTVRQAETRTALYDVLFMLVVGFWKTMRGLFVIEGETPKSGEEK